MNGWGTVISETFSMIATDESWMTFIMTDQSQREFDSRAYRMVNPSDYTDSHQSWPHRANRQLPITDDSAIRAIMTFIVSVCSIHCASKYWANHLLSKWSVYKTANRSGRWSREWLGGLGSHDVDEIRVDEEDETQSGDFHDGVVGQFVLGSDSDWSPVHVNGALT